MNIDWPTKRLKITDQGREVFLKGIGDSVVICNSIYVEQLSGLVHRDDVEQIFVIQQCSPDSHPDSAEYSAALQVILNKFEDVYAEPQGLPPRRACDHVIHS
jgi:hypothetical protein